MATRGLAHERAAQCRIKLRRRLSAAQGAGLRAASGVAAGVRREACLPGRFRAMVSGLLRPGSIENLGDL